jgi:Protein of unknown function (DUF3467)
MSEEGKTPGPAASPEAAPKMAPLDLDHVTTIYTNWYRVTGSPEEMILEFGLTPTLGMVTEDPIRVSQRLVMSFYTAKRLLAHLHYAVKRHEEVFGTLEMDFRKRAGEKR